MKKIEPNYKMSFVLLKSYAAHLHHLMVKDASYFNTRGVSDTDILTYGNLVVDLDNYYDDNEYVSLIMIAVNEKDNARSDLINLAREIGGYFLQAFGIDSEQYKRIMAGKYDHSSDDLLVSLIYDLIRIAEEMYAELSAIGLTQIKIDSLKSATDLFASEVDSVADAKVIRREKTKLRIEKANMVYSFIVKYTIIGKILSKEFSEVNYKSYLIYPNRSKKRKKVDSGATDEV